MKKCKAMTASGKQCLFEVSIGDYCLHHWKSIKYPKKIDPKSEVEVCPLCQENMKLKISKKCRKCYLEKRYKGQVSRIKSMERFE